MEISVPWFRSKKKPFFSGRKFPFRKDDIPNFRYNRPYHLENKKNLELLSFILFLIYSETLD